MNKDKLSKYKILLFIMMILLEIALYLIITLFFNFYKSDLYNLLITFSIILSTYLIFILIDIIFKYKIININLSFYYFWVSFFFFSLISCINSFINKSYYPTVIYSLLLIIFSSIDLFFTIKNKKTKVKEKPKYVYKYMNVGNNLIDDLTNSHIYLSSPNELNDPFDCNIKIHKKDKEECLELLKNYYSCKAFIEFLENNKDPLKGSKKLLTKYILKVNKFIEKHHYFPNNIKFYDYVNKYRGKDKVLDLANETLDACFKKEILDKVEEVSKTAGVACFSSKNDSILMWAHYGNSNKGVCLEIENDFDSIEVRYSEERPFLNLKTYLSYYIVGDNSKEKEFINEINVLYYLKSKEWQYENEIRYIKQKVNEKEFLNIKINRILLGTKFDFKNKDSIEFLKLAKELNIPIVYMKEDESFYKIVKDK